MYRTPGGHVDFGKSPPIPVLDIVRFVTPGRLSVMGYSPFPLMSTSVTIISSKLTSCESHCPFSLGIFSLIPVRPKLAVQKKDVTVFTSAFGMWDGGGSGQSTNCSISTPARLASTVSVSSALLGQLRTVRPIMVVPALLQSMSSPGELHGSDAVKLTFRASNAATCLALRDEGPDAVGPDAGARGEGDRGAFLGDGVSLGGLDGEGAGLAFLPVGAALGVGAGDDNVDPVESDGIGETGEETGAVDGAGGLGLGLAVAGAGDVATGVGFGGGAVRRGGGGGGDDTGATVEGFGGDTSTGAPTTGDGLVAGLGASAAGFLTTDGGGASAANVRGNNTSSEVARRNVRGSHSLPCLFILPCFKVIISDKLYSLAGRFCERNALTREGRSNVYTHTHTHTLFSLSLSLSPPTKTRGERDRHTETHPQRTGAEKQHYTHTLTKQLNLALASRALPTTSASESRPLASYTSPHGTPIFLAQKWHAPDKMGNVSFSPLAPLLSLLHVLSLSFSLSHTQTQGRQPLSTLALFFTSSPSKLAPSHTLLFTTLAA
ncbi:hypothetical protein GOP47_0008929, partial [Adiantum capillus-veneris]